MPTIWTKANVELSHAETEMGRLRLLIDRNATSVAEFDRLHATNVRAPYLLTKALLPMLTSRHGQIVFVNSSLALRATARVGAYAATRHALRAMADSLRSEVNERGVRVLSVYLGRTATPMQESVHVAEGRTYRPQRLLQPEDVAQLVTCLLGLPRTAEVTDVCIRPMIKDGRGRTTF